jgi:tRNA-dihydrouridine synthase
MGGSVFRDLLRRVDAAVTINELRALRGFCRRRLESDERLPTLDEAIERRAMAMVADAAAAASAAKN